MRVPSQIFAAAAIALVGALGAAGQGEPDLLPPEVNASRLSAGEVFPDLVLPSLDGTPRAISEFRGGGRELAARARSRSESVHLAAPHSAVRSAAGQAVSVLRLGGRGARGDHARGETPAALVAEPGGAELAQPARTFEPVAGDAADPDPRGRIRRDDGDFIRIESALVPPSVAPGDAVRVHLELYPIASKKAHWNNEADDLLLWLEPSAGFSADRRRLSTPNPAAEVSNEVRRVELEVHAGEDVQSPGRLRGYALYYVCEDVDVTCLYRRQDIEVEIPIKK